MSTEEVEYNATGIKNEVYSLKPPKEFKENTANMLIFYPDTETAIITTTGL